jgi:hypothetical protein
MLPDFEPHLTFDFFAVTNANADRLWITKSNARMDSFVHQHLRCQQVVQTAVTGPPFALLLNFFTLTQIFARAYGQKASGPIDFNFAHLQSHDLHRKPLVAAPRLEGEYRTSFAVSWGNPS